MAIWIGARSRCTKILRWDTDFSKFISHQLYYVNFKMRSRENLMGAVWSMILTVFRFSLTLFFPYPRGLFDLVFYPPKFKLDPSSSPCSLTQQPPPDTAWPCCFSPQWTDGCCCCRCWPFIIVYPVYIVCCFTDKSFRQSHSSLLLVWQRINSRLSPPSSRCSDKLKPNFLNRLLPAVIQSTPVINS